MTAMTIYSIWVPLVVHDGKRYHSEEWCTNKYNRLRKVLTIRRNDTTKVKCKCNNND